jgi:deoxyribodipyrimidine photolyase
VKPAAIHWFTSDFRVEDNTALAEAGRAGPVAGVFVLNPALLSRHAGAARRIAFMYACLHALDAVLRTQGSRHVVVEGDPAVELPRLVSKLGARLLSHAHNHEPAARARETRVGCAMASAPGRASWRGATSTPSSWSRIRASRASRSVPCGYAGGTTSAWALPPTERRMLCPDYPPPLIGLDEGRARALAAFEEARGRRTAIARRGR